MKERGLHAPKSGIIISPVILKTALGLAAIGTVGLGAYEIYENIPAVHEKVDNLSSGVSDWWKSIAYVPEAPLPSTFENDAQKQVIWQGNTLVLSQEAINKIYPDAFENNTLQLQYPLDLSKTVNPQAKISITQSSYSIKLADGRSATYYQFFFQTVDQGDSLNGAIIHSLLPNGNVILTGRSSSPNVEAGSFVDSFVTHIQDPNGNTHRLMLSGGLQVPSSSGYAYKNYPYVFESQINAPAFSSKNNGAESKRIPKRGEDVVRIASTETGNIIVHLGLIAGAEQPSNVNFVIPPRASFLTQGGKLIVAK